MVAVECHNNDAYQGFWEHAELLPWRKEGLIKLFWEVDISGTLNERWVNVTSWLGREGTAGKEVWPGDRPSWHIGAGKERGWA